MVKMADAGLKMLHLRHESNEWKRMLEFIMQENTILKTRLAEVLKDQPSNSKFVDAAETYHNDFLRADEVINLARRDVGKLDILREGHTLDQVTIHNKHNQLRDELGGIQRGFLKMKHSFNCFLSETL